MRILAAMSGGVDSAVAAARAVDAGHDVTGVHLALSKNPQSYRTGARGCCSKEDAHDARRAADVLGHSLLRLGSLRPVRRRRGATTSSPSTPPGGPRTPACAATRRSSSPPCSTGRSPSASTRSAPATTPGWCAPSTACELHRAVDAGQGPVVRARRADRGPAAARRSSRWAARSSPTSAPRPPRRGLAVADKPDSHDICFIPDGDTAGFLDAPARCPAGPTSSTEAARTVGEHDGTHRFTVGQRRGLRLGVPADDGRPRFVLDISPVDQHGHGRPAGRRCGTADHRHPARPGPDAPPAGPLAGAGADPRPRRAAARPSRRRRPGRLEVILDAPADGRGRRAGRRALRRHPGRRQRDDRRRPRA